MENRFLGLVVVVKLVIACSGGLDVDVGDVVWLAVLVCGCWSKQNPVSQNWVVFSLHVSNVCVKIELYCEFMRSL